MICPRLSLEVSRNKSDGTIGSEYVQGQDSWDQSVFIGKLWRRSRPTLNAILVAPTV